MAKTSKGVYTVQYRCASTRNKWIPCDGAPFTTLKAAQDTIKRQRQSDRLYSEERVGYRIR